MMRRAVLCVLAALGGSLGLVAGPPGLPSGGQANGNSQAAAPIGPERLRSIAELPLVADRLRTRLAQSPGDAGGWALLARTYVALGRYEQAGAAFRRALALRSEDAAVLADYADTLAFLNGRRFEGEPAALIQKALRIEPAHPGALMLAGLAAFDRRDYGQAQAFWERAVLAGGEDSAVAQAALEGIREARRRAGGP